MRFLIIYILASLFFINASQAKSKSRPARKNKVSRKIANADNFEYVYINYNLVSGNASGIQNFKVNLSPFVNFLSFEVSNHKLVFDCYPSENHTKWNCYSPCSSSQIEITFNRGKRLDRLRLNPTRITVNTCDGSGPQISSPVIINESLIYQRQNMGIRSN